MTGPAVLPAGFRLAPGEPRDIEAVVAIMAEAFDPAFGEAWTAVQCGGILPLAGVRLTLARDGEDRPIGFSLARAIGDEAELLLLAVAPAERGRGIGRALIADFVARARHDGARRLHLEVRDGNRAIAMYQANGFSVAGRRRQYYKGIDGCLFDALTLARII